MFVQCCEDESSCCQRANSQPGMPPCLPLGPPYAPAPCSAGTTPGHAGCRGWCTAAAARSTRLAAAPPQPCWALGGGRSHREWATAPPASCARHNIVAGQSCCRCKGDGCCMHDPKPKQPAVGLVGLAVIKANRGGHVITQWLPRRCPSSVETAQAPPENARLAAAVGARHQEGVAGLHCHSQLACEHLAGRGDDIHIAASKDAVESTS